MAPMPRHFYLNKKALRGVFMGAITEDILPEGATDDEVAEWLDRWNGTPGHAEHNRLEEMLYPGDSLVN